MIDRSIKHVVAVARYGSFTAAAAQLGVSQSAVTRSIAYLEKQLTYQIFIRTGRGAVVTEDGRAFVDRAIRLLEDADSLFHGSKSRSDPYADVLRVGACPGSLEWMLVDPLALVVARHPAMRMHVIGGSVERMIQQLRSGAVDVAFGFEVALNEQPDFKCLPLPPLRSAMFVRRGHPILENEEFTVADLAKYPILSPSDSRPYGAFVRRIFEGQPMNAQSQVHVADFFPLVKRIVGSTDAISFAAVEYTRSASFQARFARIRYLDDEASSAPLCCAIQTKREPRPIVRAFIKACREKMGMLAPVV
jgi:DNA-binding transcriptional LysR family regulator